ncbi:unnamed protein product [Vitrella brassicaformis CCMP3155]|uniref:Uncharacterized protein n=3 Tax=Vitrella brassicaformis TaxID=1169539 RepID=A0A0G4GRY1_VITBC|nr:unnamed protein product [Vitrella brassicaformis CCMP3155]|eukprot:CEM33358.1 unnamed protein product [Vitrella brassicaformis CCMP3155]
MQMIYDDKFECDDIWESEDDIMMDIDMQMRQEVDDSAPPEADTSTAALLDALSEAMDEFSSIMETNRDADIAQVTETRRKIDHLLDPDTSTAPICPPEVLTALTALPERSVDSMVRDMEAFVTIGRDEDDIADCREAADTLRQYRERLKTIDAQKAAAIEDSRGRKEGARMRPASAIIARTQPPNRETPEEKPQTAANSPDIEHKAAEPKAAQAQEAPADPPLSTEGSDMKDALPLSDDIRRDTAEEVPNVAATCYVEPAAGEDFQADCMAEAERERREAETAFRARVAAIEAEKQRIEEEWRRLREETAMCYEERGQLAFVAWERQQQRASRRSMEREDAMSWLMRAEERSRQRECTAMAAQEIYSEALRQQRRAEEEKRHRRMGLATRIQSLWRGWRHGRQELKKRKHELAIEKARAAEEERLKRERENSAAVAIQAAVRRCLARHEVSRRRRDMARRRGIAATVIQSVWRAQKARRLVDELRRRKAWRDRQVATQINRTQHRYLRTTFARWRHICREKAAAVEIQRHWRGYAVRSDAAMRIAWAYIHYWREKEGRREAAESAAGCVQRCWRGWRTRSALRRRGVALPCDRKRRLAAVKIQAAHRGHQLRHRLTAALDLAGSIDLDPSFFSLIDVNPFIHPPHEFLREPFSLEVPAHAHEILGDGYPSRPSPKALLEAVANVTRAMMTEAGGAGGHEGEAITAWATPPDTAASDKRSRHRASPEPSSSSHSPVSQRLSAKSVRVAAVQQEWGFQNATTAKACVAAGQRQRSSNHQQRHVKPLQRQFVRSRGVKRGDGHGSGSGSGGGRPPNAQDVIRAWKRQQASRSDEAENMELESIR